MINYIPDRGDVVILDFDPTRGKEQKGKRPGVIMSLKEFNQYGLCYVLPITSKSKGYNSEVPFTGNVIKGNILTNQMKCIDWTIRNLKYIEKIDSSVLFEIEVRLRTILDL